MSTPAAGGPTRRRTPTPQACARCGRLRTPAARWPEGPVCRTCHTRALDTYGTCAGCTRERMLPGLTPAGTRLCTDCAGIPGNFTCTECGTQGRRWQRRCARCTLTARLRHLLDDGTGTTRAELLPLFDGLRQMQRPASGLNWLGPPYVGQMLSGLATGAIPLTHDALDALPHPRAATYLRDLLMRHGVLPAADRNLLLFGRWLTAHLATVADPDHRQQIEQFATWHVQRRLRTQAEHHPLGAGRAGAARSQVAQATAFLAWLDTHGRTCATCTQDDVDAWHGDTPHRRAPSHAFLHWCMKTGRMPRLNLSIPPALRPAPISQAHRLDLIRRMLGDEHTPLRTRILAILLLLYAQPASRIARLTTGDISRDGTHTLLRLGDPPTPVPDPFATLLHHYTATRTNMNTAANPGADWLFPGRRPGEPMTPGTIRELLRHAGIPPLPGRTGALRQLLTDAPAPVIADMLGYAHTTTAVHAAHAGSPWSRYAAGPHDQQPAPGSRGTPDTPRPRPAPDPK